jgi:Pyridoxamine 5'-phosphate oxidase
MPRAIGSILPEPLLERLRGTDLPNRLGIAVLIATPDEGGWPHPAMLSYGEIVAVDSRRIRLAVHRTSRTAANLRRCGRITLWFLEAGMAYYVKGAAAERPPLEGFSHLACFDAAVQVVLTDAARADSEPGAAVVDGVRFSFDRSAAEVMRDWGAVVERLREEPCG